MILTQQSALAIDTASDGGAEEAVVIETRFGAFEFTALNRISMPCGLHGFTGYSEFGLANLPEPAPETFKLLQSMDDPGLSFIVTQLDVDAGAIAEEDLRDGASSVGIAPEAAVFLLIVTLRPSENGTTATVNLRAPIVLDLERRVARQVVLANNAYPIRRAL